MKASKGESLQSQMCSSHPILQDGVCSAAEDAVLWLNCLLVCKGGIGDRKFKIHGGMGSYGIWGGLG